MQLQLLLGLLLCGAAAHVVEERGTRTTEAGGLPLSSSLSSANASSVRLDEVCDC